MRPLDVALVLAKGAECGLRNNAVRSARVDRTIPFRNVAQSTLSIGCVGNGLDKVNLAASSVRPSSDGGSDSVKVVALDQQVGVGVDIEAVATDVLWSLS